MLKIFDCEQGSPEWYEARLGLPTASCYHKVMANPRKGSTVSLTRRSYMMHLVGERITGKSSAEYAFKSHHMERGNEWEQDVCDIYGFSHADGQELTKQGFLKHLELNTGCSVDRLVGTKGILSVKTAGPHILSEIILADRFPPEHMQQAQGELWLTEREWVDIAIYWPGMPLFVKRTKRDQAMMNEIAAAVKAFNRELDDTERQVRRYGSPTPVKDMFREAVAMEAAE